MAQVIMPPLVAQLDTSRMHLMLSIYGTSDLIGLDRQQGQIIWAIPVLGPEVACTHSGGNQLLALCGGAFGSLHNPACP